MDQMKNEMDLNAARPPLISPPTTMTVDYQIKLISMNDAFYSSIQPFILDAYRRHVLSATSESYREVLAW